jgi:hypothetical protein
MQVTYLDGVGVEALHVLVGAHKPHDDLAQYTTSSLHNHNPKRTEHSIIAPDVKNIINGTKSSTMSQSFRTSSSCKHEIYLSDGSGLYVGDQLANDVHIVLRPSHQHTFR